MDLEDILQSVRNYNMRLSPAKYSFGVQADKFLGFMLIKRGIEANPDKCQTFIKMRSSSNIKEVQQLRERLVSLSHFISCTCDKVFHFIATLKKKRNLNGQTSVMRHSQT